MGAKKIRKKNLAVKTAKVRPWIYLVVPLALTFYGCNKEQGVYSSAVQGKDGKKSEDKKVVRSCQKPKQTVSLKGKKSPPPVIEAKAGYFFFSDSKMRDAYDQGGLDVQLSGSYPIYKWLQIYASVEYLQKQSSGLPFNQKSKIWELPVNLGLQAAAVISPQTHYFVTLGPRYVFVRVHNQSPYLHSDLSQSGIGGFVNTGFRFFPYKNLTLSVFGEYSYAKLNLTPSQGLTLSPSQGVYSSSTQFGGLSFGGSIGYAF
jgi:hypothetical protein